MDERIKTLAHNLVNTSCCVKKGERVLINAVGPETQPLVLALIKAVYAAGGYPYPVLNDPTVTRQFCLGCGEEQLKTLNETELERIRRMDVYIGVRSGDNTYEMNDVPASKMELVDRLMYESSEYRVAHTRWVVLRFPSGSMAQAAKMSKEAFENYYYDVCTLDYKKMAAAMQPLVDLMKKTDKVRLVGKGTDLTFSIKDISVIPCAGEMNIPDGEVFTAPVKNSINGTLSYNTPNQYLGTVFENIVFEFKDGKIVNATSNDNKKINDILNTDDGARYVGEFAIGVNPYITKPMLDTLFDEKITGSFHLTPGASYDEAPNGNKSAIHWDLVCMQTAEYGGGEIFFDGVLIRKDGRFVKDELKVLNPENLK